MSLLKKSIVMLFSAGLGLAAGTAAATPVIAYLNFRAADGPIFPAPLVAFGFLALPITCQLLLLQAAVVAYETFCKKLSTTALLLLGGIGGAAAGYLWFLVLQSSQASAWMLIAMGGLGVFQSTLGFGCYRVVLGLLKT